MDIPTTPLSEMQLDRHNLYREETFTDLKLGSIKRLSPVQIDGSADLSRQPRFLGQTQLMSQLGPVPVNCEIEARTLEEAIDKFPAAVNAAVEEMLDEAREMRRQEAGRIVMPSPEMASKLITK
jgi:hypothetical protein